MLSQRQRIYLRPVFQHRTSDEIAHLEGVSARAVDKQLLRAKGLLGATSRFEAARMFAEFEAGVEKLYPASVAPSRADQGEGDDCADVETGVGLGRDHCDRYPHRSDRGRDGDRRLLAGDWHQPTMSGAAWPRE